MGGLMTAALGHVNTAPARKAFDERFVDQVDPERRLPPSERARRAEAARRLHMTRLALASSVVRGKKKGPGDRNARGPVEVRGASHERPTAA